MDRSVTSMTTVFHSPLSEKIFQASRKISGKTQWKLFTVALLLSDIAFFAIAFRSAYLFPV